MFCEGDPGLQALLCTCHEVISASAIGSFLAQLDKDEEDLKKFNFVRERGIWGGVGWRSGGREGEGEGGVTGREGEGEGGVTGREGEGEGGVTGREGGEGGGGRSYRQGGRMGEEGGMGEGGRSYREGGREEGVGWKEGGGGRERGWKEGVRRGRKVIRREGEGGVGEGKIGREWKIG